MCMAKTCTVYTFSMCPTFHCNFAVYICSVIKICLLEHCQSFSNYLTSSPFLSVYCHVPISYTLLSFDSFFHLEFMVSNFTTFSFLFFSIVHIPYSSDFKRTTKYLFNLSSCIKTSSCWKKNRRREGAVLTTQAVTWRLQRLGIDSLDSQHDMTNAFMCAKKDKGRSDVIGSGPRGGR